MRPYALAFMAFRSAARAGLISRPALTTVRQPVLEKGRVAGQLLLQRGDRNRPRRVSLPTELIVGTSSGAPREDQKFFSGW